MLLISGIFSVIEWEKRTRFDIHVACHHAQTPDRWEKLNKQLLLFWSVSSILYANAIVVLCSFLNKICLNQNTLEFSLGRRGLFYKHWTFLAQAHFLGFTKCSKVWRCHLYIKTITMSYHWPFVWFCSWFMLKPHFSNYNLPIKQKHCNVFMYILDTGCQMTNPVLDFTCDAFLQKMTCTSLTFIS